MILIVHELYSIVEVILKTCVRIRASYEVTLFELHALPRHVIKIEVNGILVILVQLECDRPHTAHVICNCHGTVKLLPLFCEGNIANGVPDEVVGWILFVSLSSYCNVL